MMGGFIASVTAFSVQVMHFMPGVMQWIWPSLVGVPLIIYWVRTYRKKLEKGSQLAELVEIRWFNILMYINVDRRRFYVRSDFILLLVAGFVMTALMGFYKSPRQYIVIGSFTALMWIFLWKGNSLLSNIISLVWWLKHQSKVFCAVGISIVYTIGSILILWSLQLSDQYWFRLGSSAMIYSAVTVTVIISLFMHGRCRIGNRVHWILKDWSAKV